MTSLAGAERSEAKTPEGFGLLKLKSLPLVPIAAVMLRIKHKNVIQAKSRFFLRSPARICSLFDAIKPLFSSRSRSFFFFFIDSRWFSIIKAGHGWRRFNEILAPDRKLNSNFPPFSKCHDAKLIMRGWEKNAFWKVT